VRCHACATVAPEVFSIRAETVAIARQPQTPDEHDRAMAALLICPAQAIGVGEEAA
jgi:ferredoxin